ncbi:hypothetical protein CANMA_000497 [Candida margitis]|uniref:uncharacterized protein n=1 Tax=Candida margitis TaxID=1775924 RepID=UPI002226CD69|nr:uncharacterized protein CANMA_000497 [Candida margitis]KAI5970446.1 hypothetical protein CANMA_000497 [Candida margitis]
MTASNSDQQTHPSVPSTTTAPTPHTNILQQAKQAQQQDLKQSANYIKQLHTLTNYLVSSNSDTNPLTTKSNLLDKITTIHQLNNNIEHQLNEEISVNYYNMMKMKRKVTKLSQGCRQKFDAMNEVIHIDGRDVRDEVDVSNETEANGSSSSSGRVIRAGRNEGESSNAVKVGLQKRCELIDQDLRILEHTLRLINENSKS